MSRHKVPFWDLFFCLMRFDLLTDEGSAIFGINAEVSDDSVVFGAFYLPPGVVSKVMRLAYKDVRLQIELPEELLDQATAFVAWDIELPLINEQVREPAI